MSRTVFVVVESVWDSSTVHAVYEDRADAEELLAQIRPTLNEGDPLSHYIDERVLYAPGERALALQSTWTVTLEVQRDGTVTSDQSPWRHTYLAETPEPLKPVEVSWAYIGRYTVRAEGHTEAEAQLKAQEKAAEAVQAKLEGRIPH